MKPNTDLVPLLSALGHRPLARLRPRTAAEIGQSPWSIGCETIDRGYVDFAHTGPHLRDLGATLARVQAGWARCEPHADGRYHWDWLDAVVDGCLAQGVRPWLQTSYGNPAYPGGGGIGLADGPPTSPQALEAWDNWVTALARRYGERVFAWEIWNEPDIHGPWSGEGYAELFVRTANRLRAVDPRARIIALGLAHNLEFAERFLARLVATGSVHLLDELTFHFYPHNPDDEFEAVQTLAAHLRQHAPQARLRQGETGAPAETIAFMALGKFQWNDRKQAAWNTRRLLAHHARGIPMNLFQLADMQYTKAGGARFEGRNSKGLLCINADKTVSHRRPSFFAAQSVFNIFDSTLELTELPNLARHIAPRTSAYAWKRAGEQAASLVGWWRCDDAPALATPALGELALPPVALRDAVLVDLLSGTVFTPPTDWQRLPCADVPLLLAERRVLHLAELEERA